MKNTLILQFFEVFCSKLFFLSKFLIYCETSPAVINIPLQNYSCGFYKKNKNFWVDLILEDEGGVRGEGSKHAYQMSVVDNAEKSQV